MTIVRRSDAASLTIEELCAEHPDGGRAMEREIADAERVLAALPRSGKEIVRGRSIAVYTLVTRSGRYQIVYAYAESENLVEIDDVIPTRSSMRL